MSAVLANDAPRGLLRRLGAQGVAVRLEGGNLHVSAPLGVLDTGTLEQLRAFKPEIVEILTTHGCSRCGRGSFNRVGVICFWCARSLPDPAR